MNLTKREEFLAWLEAQTGSAYVWGAQGQRIGKDNCVYKRGRLMSKDYKAWIKLRENSDRNAQRAINYISAALEAGAEGISCFDCSGLIMAYVKDIRGWLSTDLSARGLFGIAEELPRDEIAPGDLAFCHNGERITHVGVYVGGGYTIDARGRESGVIKQKLDAGPWNRFGRLAALDEAPTLEPQAAYGRCSGGSVHIRSGAGCTYPILATAHEGDRLLAMPEENGWHRIAVCCKGRLLTGYISAKYMEYA